jgi:peptidoglycan/xylan/chitin deacetylase (PgdA/CDA1 family)
MDRIKRLIKRIILWYSYVFFRKNRRSKIFYYHDIFDKIKYTDMGTPLPMFKKHIEVIRNNGFEIVDKIQNPDNEIIICFDDGFRGIYDTKDFFIQNNIKPLVFIAVELIGKENYLSKEEILELQSAGFQFESHTWSHIDLTQCDAEDLKHELLDSKKYLTNLLGKEVVSICFPKGYFSERIIETSLNGGYEHLYTSLPGNFYNNVDKRLIYRNLVQFSTPKELKYKLLGNPSIMYRRGLKLYYKNQ